MKDVEEEMRRIVKESLSLQVCEKSKDEAIAFMENAHEEYKLELIRELDDSEKISFYKQGDYEEFCAGPHISNTCQIKAIKLLSVAGAYWRGDEKNKMLTRIYGISFPKVSELEEYLHMMEEAKARMDKVPYMIIVGEKEKNNKSISVRQRDGEPDKQEMGEMQLEEFVKMI